MAPRGGGRARRPLPSQSRDTPCGSGRLPRPADRRATGEYGARAPWPSVAATDARAPRAWAAGGKGGRGRARARAINQEKATEPFPPSLPPSLSRFSLLAPADPARCEPPTLRGAVLTWLRRRCFPGAGALGAQATRPEEEGAGFDELGGELWCGATEPRFVGGCVAAVVRGALSLACLRSSTLTCLAVVESRWGRGSVEGNVGAGGHKNRWGKDWRPKPARFDGKKTH